MKKLLLSLMVLTVLASCGKDNKVASGSTSSNPAIIGLTSTDQTGIALGTKIDQYLTSFGTGSIYINYYQSYTYQWLMSNAIILDFSYTKSTQSATGNGQNCETKFYIFYVCSYTSATSTSTSNVTTSKKLISNQVDIAAKQNELKAIINDVSPLYPIQAQGTSYYIKTRSGAEYIIDTRYPLQANPIGVKTTVNGVATYEYLYNITMQ